MRQVILLALVASAAAIHVNFEIEVPEVKKGLKAVGTPQSNPHAECSVHTNAADCSADPGNGWFYTKCQWIVFRYHGVADPEGRGICEPYHVTPQEKEADTDIEFFEKIEKRPKWVKHCLKADTQDKCAAEESCQWVHWQVGYEAKGKCVPFSSNSDNADDSSSKHSHASHDVKKPRWVRHCLKADSQDKCETEESCQWVHWQEGLQSSGKCVPYHNDYEEETMSSGGNSYNPTTPSWVKNCLSADSEKACSKGDRCQWIAFGPPGSSGAGKCVPGPKDVHFPPATLGKKKPQWVKNCLVQNTEDDCDSSDFCQWIAFGPSGSKGPGKCVPGPKLPQEVLVADLDKKAPGWVKNCLDQDSQGDCEAEDRCLWVAFGPPGSASAGKCVPGPKDVENQELLSLGKKSAKWVKNCLAQVAQSDCEAADRCQWVAFGPPGADVDGKCVPGPKVDVEEVLFSIEEEDEEPEWIKTCLETLAQDACEATDRCQWVSFEREGHPSARGKCVPQDDDTELFAKEKKSKKPKWVKECLKAKSQHHCGKADACHWIPFGPPGSEGPGKCVPWTELSTFLMEVEVGKKPKCLSVTSEKKCDKKSSCKWIAFGPPGSKGPGRCVQWKNDA